MQIERLASRIQTFCNLQFLICNLQSFPVLARLGVGFQLRNEIDTAHVAAAFEFGFEPGFHEAALARLIHAYTKETNSHEET